jgi:hypothetical protein
VKKLLFNISISICIVCLTAILCTGQQLSVADSLYLQNIKTELSLSDRQITQVDSIMIATSQEFMTIEKEIQRNARTTENLADRDATQSTLLQRKKKLKSDRELALKSLLTSEQLDIYDSKIKPAKPAVIHMGINHDRASCTTCLPK